MRGTLLSGVQRGLFAVPLLVLACVAYVAIALPPSMLGVVWPSMRTTFHEPVGALGLLLPFAITAEIVSSACSARVIARLGVGPLLAASIALSAVAQTVFSMAPSLWVVAGGLVLGGTAFGLIDSGLNAFAAEHLDAREINWMHASYGLGAVCGPLLVTLLPGTGASWRWAYAILALVMVAAACAFTLTVRRWRSAPTRPPVAGRPSPLPAPIQRSLVAAIVVGVLIVAVQAGIEAGISLWGFVFLSAGRGLPQRVAGLTVAAYWGAIFIGRILLGTVAQRLGPERVLLGAIAGELVGTAVMAVPGSGLVAAAGMIVVGLAAAPVFPLLTLTTGDRVGEDHATRTVTFQVAASAAGGAGLPAGMGLLIGALSGGAVAPALLVLAVALCALGAVSMAQSRRRVTRVTPHAARNKEE